MKSIFNKIKKLFSNINFKSKKVIISLVVLIVSLLALILVKSYAYFYYNTDDYIIFSGGVFAQQEEAIINIYRQYVEYYGGYEAEIYDEYELSNYLPDNGYVINHEKSNCIGGVSISHLDEINDISEIDSFDVHVDSKGMCNIYLDVNTEQMPIIYTIYDTIGGLGPVSSRHDDLAIQKIKSHYNNLYKAYVDSYYCIDGNGEYLEDYSFSISSTNSGLIQIHNNELYVSKDYPQGAFCEIWINANDLPFENVIRQDFGNPETEECYERPTTADGVTGVPRLICDEGERIVGYDNTDDFSETIPNWVQVKINKYSMDDEEYETQLFRVIGIVDAEYDSNDDGILDSKDKLIKLFSPFQFEMSNLYNAEDNTDFTQSRFYQIYKAWFFNNPHPIVAQTKYYRPVIWWANGDYNLSNEDIINVEDSDYSFISYFALPYLSDMLLSIDDTYNNLHVNNLYEYKFHNNDKRSWVDNDLFHGYYVDYLDTAYDPNKSTDAQKYYLHFASSSSTMGSEYTELFVDTVMDTVYNGPVIYLKPGVFVTDGNGSYDSPWIIEY